MLRPYSAPAGLRGILSISKRFYATSSSPSKILYALPKTPEEQAQQVRRFLEAKEKTGLSFTEIAKRCQLTNAFVANVFYGRARLDDETASKLRKVVPALTHEDIEFMKRAPLRTFDERQFQDPTCYRLNEAVSQYAEAIKALINEEFGDGIMSAIGLYVQVEKVTGPEGEPRVVITFNGKFLPQIVQNTSTLEKMKKSD